MKPECLRNQLKRHFPDVIPNRDKLRRQLGLAKQPIRGLKPSTTAKYAPAIAMLRETDLTVKEVAEKCKVSFYGLQQHLLFYHKDVAEKRLAQRTQALSKTLRRGDKDSCNRTVGSRSEAEALYADAIELYRTTSRTATDIAVELGFNPHNLISYIQRWYREDMTIHQKLRQEQAEERRMQRKVRMENSRIVKAERMGVPAKRHSCHAEKVGEVPRSRESVLQYGRAYQAHRKAAGFESDISVELPSCPSPRGGVAP